MRKVLPFLVILVAVAVAGALFFSLTTEKNIDKKVSSETTFDEELSDLQRVEELIAQSKLDIALEIILPYMDRIESGEENGKQWLNLLIRVSEDGNNSRQLATIYEYYPDALDEYEKAALIVADKYLKEKNLKSFHRISYHWDGHKTLKDAWFVLDADSYLLQGNRIEAINLLKSREFEGKKDVGRLVRLALVYANEDPKQSWEYLTQAYQKDPKNSSIRTYRAKLLENVDKHSLALSEYLAAIQLSPQDPYLRDQLGEFFLKNQQYPLALNAWKEALNPNGIDKIWLKTIFWNRTTTPIEFDWQSLEPPQGPLTPLIKYLLSLNPGEFWNHEKFEQVPHHETYLIEQQSTFWLALLDALKQKNENKARKILRFNHFKGDSWNPELELALMRILEYRHNRTFTLDESGTILEDVIEEKKLARPESVQKESILFEQLNTLAEHEILEEEPEEMPITLNTLLNGPDVFTAAFLSAGWLEAALQMNTLEVVPKLYPDWFTYSLSQAIRQNRGDRKALEFALKQPKSTSLDLLIGELLIAEGNPDEALKYLEPLRQYNNSTGFRSSWLVSLVEIEKGNYEEANKVIKDQSLLSEDVLGKETLARIALLQEDIQKATDLYKEIEKESAEAKSYLARKAFSEKNWKRAKYYTEALLREYPNNRLLQENLKKILENERSQEESRYL